MDNISFGGSTDNLWRQAYLSPVYHESASEFSLRLATVNHYQGPPRSIMRTNSDPRADFYPSVCTLIASVVSQPGNSPPCQQRGIDRQSYYISLSPAATEVNNAQARERCTMPFSEHRLPCQSAPTATEKFSLIRTLRNFLFSLIPCIKVKKQNY